MSMETDGLNQKAVLWTASGNFDNSGKSIVNKPVEICVRWEDKKGQSTDPQGNTISTDATVMVDCHIPIMSIMWKGSLRNLPSPPINLLRVMSYEEIPDLECEEFQRTVILQRHSNTLPTVSS